MVSSELVVFVVLLSSGMLFQLLLQQGDPRGTLGQAGWMDCSF
jgi:hypothetical protein